MAKGKAGARDAEIILRLYDLRREALLRTARKFMVTEFWPAEYEEYKTLINDFGSERNAWARQVLSYWDMAAALVLQGALDEQLFYATQNELYFLAAKFGSHIAQYKKDTANPEYLQNFETMAGKPYARSRVKMLRARIESRLAAARAAKV